MGDRHLCDGAGPTVLYGHEPCGHDTTGVLVCPHCSTAVTADNTSGRPALRDGGDRDASTS